MGPRSEERHTSSFSKVGFLKMEPLFLEISTSFFFSSEEEDLQNLFYYAWKLQKRNPFEHRDQVSLTIEICTYVFEDGPKSVLWKKEMATHVSGFFLHGVSHQFWPQFEIPHSDVLLTRFSLGREEGIDFWLEWLISPIILLGGLQSC